MSDIKKPVTLTVLAERYADAASTAERAEVRMTEHADWPAHVDAVKAGLKAKTRGIAGAEARKILGLPADAPIKAGPKGAQKYVGKGRRIESVASALTRAAAGPSTPAEPGVIRVTMSGEGGSTLTFSPGDAAYDDIRRSLFGA